MKTSNDCMLLASLVNFLLYTYFSSVSSGVSSVISEIGIFCSSLLLGVGFRVAVCPKKDVIGPNMQRYSRSTAPG